MDDSGPEGLTTEEIAEIPEVSLYPVSPPQCSICLEDIKRGSKAKVLSCDHLFHSPCIITWLQRRSTCPVCRANLAKYSRDYDLEEGEIYWDNDEDFYDDEDIYGDEEEWNALHGAPSRHRLITEAAFMAITNHEFLEGESDGDSGENTEHTPDSPIEILSDDSDEGIPEIDHQLPSNSSESSEIIDMEPLPNYDADSESDSSVNEQYEGNDPVGDSDSPPFGILDTLVRTGSFVQDLSISDISSESLFNDSDEPMSIEVDEHYLSEVATISLSESDDLTEMEVDSV
ncbi:Zinc finger, C3HHypothetical protein type (RING finger) [Nesidiocoris tenuis]|uniref:RING-type domain-containing protein n=1 Tax=Nesidiocoris tenuis TaxID=355587 RepID=A0ABN7A9N0_9HEMI|nr:Zinc finger, C3HHypothetical protein type (RING finger) [Nesidiocoris tenuis]